MAPGVPNGWRAGACDMADAMSRPPPGRSGEEGQDGPDGPRSGALFSTRGSPRPAMGGWPAAAAAWAAPGPQDLPVT